MTDQAKPSVAEFVEQYLDCRLTSYQREILLRMQEGRLRPIFTPRRPHVRNKPIIRRMEEKGENDGT